MVVSKVAEFWKVEDWLLIDDLVILIILDLNYTLFDKVHFFHVGFIIDHSLTGVDNSAKQRDDQLIREPSFTLIEKVIERFFKLLEHSGVLNDFSLHFWGNLLIEIKLLDDQIEIVQKGLLNIFSDVVIESWLNMVWLVRFLYLFDPHVERI